MQTWALLRYGSGLRFLSLAKKHRYVLSASLRAGKFAKQEQRFDYADRPFFASFAALR
jgi:hypothetical protein